MLRKKKRVMIFKKFCLDISEDLKCVENKEEWILKKKEKKKKNQKDMCDYKEKSHFEALDWKQK